LSKISLSGNPSGTGTFTIAAPNSDNSRTMTLPDSAGDVVVTQATQTLTNKTFSGAQVFGTASLAEPSGTAPLYMARAWVNFDGTTSPGTIRASGNVSSVTRNGTGDYTVNFTTAMPDANYCAVGNAGPGGAGGSTGLIDAQYFAPTTSSQRILTYTFTAGAGTNLQFISVAIFR
jgi:hypothetical protein